MPKKVTEQSQGSREINNAPKVRKVAKTGAERIREYRARIRALENAAAAESTTYVEGTTMQTASQPNLEDNQVDMRENQSSLLYEAFSQQSNHQGVGDNHRQFLIPINVHQNLPLFSEAPSTSTMQMQSNTQKVTMLRRHLKTAKTPAERARAYRERKKALKKATNPQLMIDTTHSHVNVGTSTTRRQQCRARKRPYEHDVDTQQYLQATQLPIVTNVAIDNFNQVTADYLKEEPEDNDIDIGPIVHQHMDSYYRTGQPPFHISHSSEASIGVQANIKQEDEAHNEEDGGGLCKVENDGMLCSQVKLESSTDSQRAMDTQQCFQAMHPPTVSNVAVDNLNQVNEVYVKEEPKDIDIDIGPAVLQHMDSHYRTGQTNIKQEHEVRSEDHERELCNVDNEQVLCIQVKVEFTEDSQKVVSELDRSQFRCNKCLKIFQSKMVLLAHQKHVHATDRLKCGVCKKEFKCKKYLANHVRNSHSSQKYECDVCKKMYKSNQMLQKHILSLHRNNLTDSSPDYYKCDKCLKTYLHKDTLMQHYKQVHGTDAHKCDECNKEFKCKTYLLNHWRYAHSRQQFECDICKKICKTKQKLYGHILNHHRHKSVESEFRCDKCFKIFKSKAMLLVHQKYIHQTDELKCGVCTKEFKCKKYLVRHIRDTHNDQVYECDVCKKIYKRKEILRKHITSHYSARGNYKCDMCLKTYCRTDVLAKHFKQIHGAGSHKCNKCNKEFKCEEYLLHHKRINCTWQKAV